MPTLEGFSIRNFRLFEELELSGLRRVNLFVGKNNTGKSALLEALQVYAERADLWLLRELSTGHPAAAGGIPAGLGVMENVPASAGELRHLFPGHRFPEPGGSGASLGPPEGSPLRLRVISSPAQRNGNGNGKGSARLAHRWLVREQDDAVDKLADLDAYAGAVATTTEPAARVRSRRVSSHPLERAEVAAVWDGLEPSVRSRVTGTLRLLEPGLEDLDVRTLGSGSGPRVPVARLSGVEGAVPVQDLGDGVERLFQLLVALAGARGGGLLLVDEIEQGLHWSIQQPVWEAIFELAQELDVQVFATTHSRDCVAAFEQAWAKRPEEGAFFRLERREDGSSHAVTYPRRVLSNSVTTGVEMR